MTTETPREAHLPTWRRREADTHKGDYGRILVVAGSRRMPGAALLSALSALRGGAGLVRLAIPSEIMPWIVGQIPCAIFDPYDGGKHGALTLEAVRELEAVAATCDVVAIGPGLGSDLASQEAILQLASRIAKPMVLDADALNAAALRPNVLAQRRAATILTPHPLEFSRLESGTTPRGEERRARAEAFARRLNCVVILKGHESVITDGRATYVNRTGNPGMATAGTGDVLTGVLGALMHRYPDPLDAAILGAHVHGLAGDLAVATASETGLIASDLIDSLPSAFRVLEQS